MYFSDWQIIGMLITSFLSNNGLFNNILKVIYFITDPCHLRMLTHCILMF